VHLILAKNIKERNYLEVVSMDGRIILIFLKETRTDDVGCISLALARDQ
jgi:hypothetical protein